MCFTHGVHLPVEHPVDVMITVHEAKRAVDFHTCTSADLWRIRRGVPVHVHTCSIRGVYKCPSGLRERWGHTTLSQGLSYPNEYLTIPWIHGQKLHLSSWTRSCNHVSITIHLHPGVFQFFFSHVSIQHSQSLLITLLSSCIHT